MDNIKKAYITSLSTENYLIGVLALKECLNRVKAKYPLVTLVNDTISNEAIEKLKAMDIIIIKKDRIKIPDEVKKRNDEKLLSRWSNTFDKLLVFGLTEFDKLVYIDSDMYIRKNIDELFEKPHMSATVDRKNCCIDFEWMKMTSGLIVIEPKKNLDLELTETMKKVQEKYSEFGDQDVIQWHYPEWEKHPELHLPLKYNMFVLHLDYYVKHSDSEKFDGRDYEMYDLDDIAVYHFITRNKPWQYSPKTIQEYADFQDEIRKIDYDICTDEEQRKMFEAAFKLGRDITKKITLEYMEILDKVK